MLQKLKTAANKTVGMKQTIKAVQSGSAEVVFLARDVDDHLASRITEACKTAGVEIILVDSMAELGEACGIQVGASTAAIVK
ncbi:MAG TPA: ribosomal L7Ae/L30e/S12e/Gadd45 family protein [Candidatus Atribacteria bacterium]|nr:ribosomal L7Ae/L30e/S12e/Gadd45 family protein [Candidatus Atribacteria bacterium]HPT79118.1 ribosomal L7Ae/L30e/S12e/Gadd45 family protein [Candidatus Atribacteria bacterium]